MGTLRKLTFLDTCTRTRRDHEKYLTLIDTIALLHQHQRDVKRIERRGQSVEYIEVTLSDIAAANRLAGAVLGRSLDELPPQTRRFLEAMTNWVVDVARQEGTEPEAYRFTARAVRDALATGATQTKIHLSRLVDLEYVLAHRTGPRSTYELLYRGEGVDGSAFLPGLIDVEALEQEYDGDRSGVKVDRSGSGRPPAGGQSVPGRRVSERGKSAPQSRISSLAAFEKQERAAKGEVELMPYVVAASAAGNGNGNGRAAHE